MSQLKKKKKKKNYKKGNNIQRKKIRFSYLVIYVLKSKIIRKETTFREKK